MLTFLCSCRDPSHRRLHQAYGTGLAPRACRDVSLSRQLDDLALVLWAAHVALVCDSSGLRLSDMIANIGPLLRGGHGVFPNVRFHLPLFVMVDCAGD